MVFSQTNEEVQPGRWPVRSAGAHNTFLALALDTGIPGLVLFVWLLQRIVSNSFSGFRHAGDAFMKAVSLGVGVCIIGMAVRLFFDHMFVGTAAILFWVLVALSTPAGVYSTNDSQQVASS